MAIVSLHQGQKNCILSSLVRGMCNDCIVGYITSYPSEAPYVFPI